MTTLSSELRELGDALERAATADLARPRWSLGRRPRVAAVLVALAVGVPGLAYATGVLINSDEIAAGLPAGTRMLEGTAPRCRVVQAGVEYRCVLTRLPAHPEVADLKGTVEPTVDATKHVNGGCRSLASDGRVWECYLGRAAVEQQIIGPDFLGEYAPTPGVG
jgi:hypothetical protein